MFNSHHKFLRLDTITNLCFTESEGTERLSNLCKDTQLLASSGKTSKKRNAYWSSLVVQWLRIHPVKQGTRV